MLVVQSMEYYKKSLDILNIIEDEINFLNDSIPYNEKEYIIRHFLNSRLGTNSSDYVYYIYKSECDNGDLLKYYNDKFNSFNKDFKFHNFSIKVAEVKFKYQNICNEYKYEDNCIRLFIDNLNDLSILHEKYE